MATYDLTNLPTSVTPGTFLDGIKSTGTQCINTKYKPNQNTRLVMDVTLTNNGANPRSVFGTRDTHSSTDPNAFALWVISATGFRTDYSTTNATMTLAPDGRFTIDKNKNVTKINGTTHTAATSTF